MNLGLWRAADLPHWASPAGAMGRHDPPGACFLTLPQLISMPLSSTGRASLGYRSGEGGRHQRAMPGKEHEIVSTTGLSVSSLSCICDMRFVAYAPNRIACSSMDSLFRRRLRSLDFEPGHSHGGLGPYRNLNDNLIDI